jgi:hypothetical protein
VGCSARAQVSPVMIWQPLRSFKSIRGTVQVVVDKAGLIVLVGGYLGLQEYETESLGE